MITIDGNNLTLEEIANVAFENHTVTLSDQARQKVDISHSWVADIVSEGKPVYGINTGFGIFADKQITPEDTAALNRNLVLSHAVGTGQPLPHHVVRAAMLIRANTLASGHSGLRLELLENLISMLNQNVIPEIPSQGSLGSSGDLAPLSHLALVLTTDENDREQDSGWATYDGQRISGKSAMKAAGIERLILQSKESLAITNGATFSAALAALNIIHSRRLLGIAEISLSMTLEALQGASNAFDERLHAIRRQTGQQKVAEKVRTHTQGSTMLDAAGRVQDAYSLRCAPQVQGAARDTLEHVENIIAREINAVTDNPLLFGPGEAISGGNFHGEPVGMVMDFLKIAISEISAIAERRIYHLTDGKINAGLPPMLVENDGAAGVNSGMMMPQYTAASLVLENQNLANPDSVHSLPTSGGKEDHNANAMTAARTAAQVIENCSHVLAIEMYCAARALDLRLKVSPESRLGKGVAKAHEIIRSEIPFIGPDQWWGPEIERMKSMVFDGKFDKLI